LGNCIFGTGIISDGNVFKVRTIRGLTKQSLSIYSFIFRVTQPIFLGELINYYSTSGGDINEAYLYAGAVILCTALNVLFMHPYMLSILHCGMKLRVAACSLIYRKTLRLSKNSLGDTTAGQIVNLLSNDVGR
jgi:ATP-binding cassette, subfamily C (CFTR/MRP), member 4